MLSDFGSRAKVGAGAGAHGAEVVAPRAQGARRRAALHGYVIFMCLSSLIVIVIINKGFPFIRDSPLQGMLPFTTLPVLVLKLSRGGLRERDIERPCADASVRWSEVCSDRFAEYRQISLLCFAFRIVGISL